MEKNEKIYVAGHSGMVGSAIVHKLEKKGFDNLVLRTHKELDLINQIAVEELFQNENLQYVFIAAAKVGGIHANNTFRAQFIYENLMIQNNLIHAAHKYNVKKLLFLGSSCIYPRDAKQPIKEEYLLSGSLEPTNEPYAIAKIAGIKMCENYHRQYGSNFISVMPTNLYGPNDNYDLQTSHVIPALIRKMHESKIAGRETVTIWGSGQPRREFLHVDDVADACLFIMNNVKAIDFFENMNISHINVGTGIDITISDLAKKIASVVGYSSEIKYDSEKPDGPPRKLLDISRLKTLGWEPTISLSEGLKDTYELYLENENNVI